jgi:hypothetical protein
MQTIYAIYMHLYRCGIQPAGLPARKAIRYRILMTCSHKPHSSSPLPLDLVWRGTEYLAYGLFPQPSFV